MTDLVDMTLDVLEDFRRTRKIGIVTCPKAGRTTSIASCSPISRPTVDISSHKRVTRKKEGRKLMSLLGFGAERGT